MYLRRLKEFEAKVQCPIEPSERLPSRCQVNDARAHGRGAGVVACPRKGKEGEERRGKREEEETKQEEENGEGVALLCLVVDVCCHLRGWSFTS